MIDDPHLRQRTGVFVTRADAGHSLARMLDAYRGRSCVVLAIPSGGVPVGLAVSHDLDLPFDLVIVRKIPIPGNPEAGFGAMALDGRLFLNQGLTAHLGLTEGHIDRLAIPVREELKRRNEIFRGGRPTPDLAGLTALLVDDGLASGYTMRAAVHSVHVCGAPEVVVAVPTASDRALAELTPRVDRLYCANVRSGPYFAVAEAYRQWYDLEPAEVIKLLGEANWLRKEGERE